MLAPQAPITDLCSVSAVHYSVKFDAAELSDVASYRLLPDSVNACKQCNNPGNNRIFELRTPPDPSYRYAPSHSFIVHTAAAQVEKRYGGWSKQPRCLGVEGLRGMLFFPK